MVNEDQSKKKKSGTSLAVQWLRLYISTEGGLGSIPAQEPKIPPAMQYCKKNFFNIRIKKIKF